MTRDSYRSGHSHHSSDRTRHVSEKRHSYRRHPRSLRHNRLTRSYQSRRDHDDAPRRRRSSKRLKSHRSARRLQYQSTTSYNSRPGWQYETNPDPNKVDTTHRTRYNDIFRRSRAACRDQQGYCNRNCEAAYCRYSRSSLYCTRCSNNCLTSGRNTCTSVNTQSRNSGWQYETNPDPNRVDSVQRNRYNNVFRNVPSNCNNRQNVCNQNCETHYCSVSRNSMYCQRCNQNCLSSAQNTCSNNNQQYNNQQYNNQQSGNQQYNNQQYNNQQSNTSNNSNNPFQDKINNEFNNNTMDKCDNYVNRFCKKYCYREACRRSPSSSECSSCRDTCASVGRNRCDNNYNVKREMDEHRRRVQQSFERVYNSTFTDAPMLTTKRDEFCKSDCDKNYCIKDAEAYSCVECVRTCQARASYYRNQMKRVPAETTLYFNDFFNETHKCTRVHGEIVGLCRRAKCSDNDPYHANCIKCIKHGVEGARQACVAKIRKDTYQQQVFTGVVPFFKRRPFMCDQCNASIGAQVCDRYCQYDQKCKQACNKNISEAACLTTCVNGDRKEKYKQKFTNALTTQFNKRKESCQSCSSFCQMDWLRTCYETDTNCKNEFIRQCTEQCNMAFCKAYQDRRYQYSQNVAGSKELYQQDLILSLQRAKRRQALRAEYDQKKIEKIQELALNLKRNAIFDSIKLMEGLIYEEQRELTNQTQQKELKYEEEIMKKIQSAYTTQEALGLETNAEILIFES